jgi:hypothetical protein
VGGGRGGGGGFSSPMDIFNMMFGGGMSGKYVQYIYYLFKQYLGFSRKYIKSRVPRDSKYKLLRKICLAFDAFLAIYRRNYRKS